MIIWLYRQIQGIRKALAGRDRPEELAWALALGTLVGLVPKGNLVAIALIVVLLALRINHAMAAVTAVVVSCIAWVIDPFTHQLGNWVLSISALQGFYNWSWQQPIVPWTDLNNTVVMGSLILGAIGLIPIYNLTLPMFQSLAARRQELELQSAPAIPRPPAPAVEPAIKPAAALDIPDFRTDRPHPKVDVIRVQHSEAQAALKAQAQRVDTHQSTPAPSNNQEDAA